MEISKKFLLLDTNVLIDSVKFSDDFAGFYEWLADKEAIPVLDPTVKFEFFRGARSQNEFSGYKSFLQELMDDADTPMPYPTKEDYLNAQRIAAISLKANNKEIHFPDCLIGARLAAHSNPEAQLYLVTQNHKDFPPTLFTLEHSEVIRLTDGNLKTIGFYSFNKARFTQLCRELPEAWQLEEN